MFPVESHKVIPPDAAERIHFADQPASIRMGTVERAPEGHPCLGDGILFASLDPPDGLLDLPLEFLFRK